MKIDANQMILSEVFGFPVPSVDRPGSSERRSNCLLVDLYKVPLLLVNVGNYSVFLQGDVVCLCCVFLDRKSVV